MSDVDAVTAVGPAGDDAMQKSDFAPLFGYINVIVDDVWQEVGQTGQFVIMGGEERARFEAWVVVSICLTVLKQKS